MISSSNMRNNGFTLIEVLVVVAIVSSLLIVIFALQRDIFSLNQVFQSTLAAHGDVQRAMKQMSSEIRSMTQSSQGAYPIELARENELIFYRDINGDGIHERVRYFLEDDMLQKGVIAPVEDDGEVIYDDGDEQIRTIVRHVSNSNVPVFLYYGSVYPEEDGSNALSFDGGEVVPNSIRLVRIIIDVGSTQLYTGQPIVFTTYVVPRNLRN